MHRSIEKERRFLWREDSSLSLLLIMRRYVNVIHQNFSYSVPHMVQLGKGGGIQNDFRSSHVASKRRYGDGV